MTPTADLWTDIGKWWATIDWGDAPGWLGAILTSGSLFLAVFIIARDRHRDRMSEARKVIVRHQVSSPFGEQLIDFTAYNANDHPIPLVSLHHWGGTIWHRHFLSTKTGSMAIPPASEGTKSLGLKKTPRDRDYVISMIDSNGVEWFRGAVSGRILSRSVASRWLRRGRLQRMRSRVAWAMRKRG